MGPKWDRAGQVQQELLSQTAYGTSRTDLTRSQLRSLRRLFPIRAPVPKPAAQLHGEYVLLDVLGRGAFGVAYKARHVQSGRLVCIKSLKAPVPQHVRSGSGTDSAFGAQRREVAVLAALVHPNIVQYVECFGDALSGLHIAMEWADGGDLATLLRCTARGSGRLNESDVLGMFVQLVLAIAHVHALGLLHRDVKV